MERFLADILLDYELETGLIKELISRVPYIKVTRKLFHPASVRLAQKHSVAPHPRIGNGASTGPFANFLIEDLSPKFVVRLRANPRSSFRGLRLFVGLF